MKEIKKPFQKTVTFKEEDNNSYKVVSENVRFMICTRPFCMSADKDILQDRVKMGAFLNIETAFNFLKDNIVYTIVDLKNNVRGIVRNIECNFKTKEEIDFVMQNLLDDEYELTSLIKAEYLFFDVGMMREYAKDNDIFDAVRFIDTIRDGGTIMINTNKGKKYYKRVQSDTIQTSYEDDSTIVDDLTKNYVKYIVGRYFQKQKQRIKVLEYQHRLFASL